MPVDASIYGGIQQVRPANRLAQLAQVMQLEGLQNQNDAAMYTRRKAAREDAEVNALNAAYRDAVGSDGTVDRNKLYQAVAAGGLGSRLPAIQKSFADADTATTNQRKAEFDLRKQTTEAVGQAFMGVMQNPTPENAAATIDLLGSRKYFTPQEVAEFKQIVSTNPQAIGPLAERMVRLTASVKDQAPTFETRNLGGTTDTLRRDALTGKVETVNSVQNTQSPDNKASVGASLANAAATREVASATRDAARISSQAKQDRDTELKLQDDYRTESKGFAETSTAMKKVLAAIETADKNPGSALAAGTGFMKILDPNSVVRETELGMALNASGWFDRATNIANTLQNGRVMTAEQKKNLRAAAADLFEEAKAAQREIDAAYNKRATDYKLDPKRIITDRGQNTPRTAAPAAGGREAVGKVSNAQPDIFGQADAILRGGR